MFQRVLNRRGFTLVELMIVVAVIGILAAIAIPNFLSFRLKAKTAEAKTNLGVIRSLELAYFAEYNLWVADVSEVPRAIADLDGKKAVWNSQTAFSIIGFAPESMVYYTYGVQPAGTTYVSSTVGFTATATADLDDDSLPAIYRVNNMSVDLPKTGTGAF